MKLLLILTALLVVGFAANPMPQYRAEVEMKDGVPMYINYQGYLTDLNGNPINNTSPGLAMSFSIYDAESGGSYSGDRSCRPFRYARECLMLNC